jgi:hypothetical protein
MSPTTTQPDSDYQRPQFSFLFSSTNHLQKDSFIP